MTPDLPSNWENWRLADVGAWHGGGTPASGETAYWDGEIPWVSPKDMKALRLTTSIDKITPEAIENSAAKLIPSGAVLFVTRSGILAHSFPVAVSDVAVTVNQDIKASKPVDVIDPVYLAWALRAAERKILSSCSKHGTTVHSIEMPRLKELVIPIPPEPEQRRIVAKIEELFSELDKGVESLTTAREQLKAYRQSVLKNAFVGKLTEGWRAKNCDTLESPESLLARIKKEREDRYKAALDVWETALAKWRAAGEKDRKPGKPPKPAWPEERDFNSLTELPRGWFYLPFESVAWSIRNGISAKPDEFGPLKIFRISAVRPMTFNLTDFRRITDPDGSMEEYRLNHGDLVFTRYNGSRDYVGVSAMYRGDGSHVYPDKLIRCEIKSEILNPAFLEGATNSGESRAFLEQRIRTTAGQSGVSGGDIKATPVPVCSPSEQAEIVRIVESQLQAAHVMEAEIVAGLARADALRQSILKRAFSGQLVAQDSADEPASELLGRIRAEREEGGAKKRPNNTNNKKEAA